MSRDFEKLTIDLFPQVPLDRPAITQRYVAFLSPGNPMEEMAVYTAENIPHLTIANTVQRESSELIAFDSGFFLLYPPVEQVSIVRFPLVPFSNSAFFHIREGRKKMNLSENDIRNGLEYTVNKELPHYTVIFENN